MNVRHRAKRNRNAQPSALLPSSPGVDHPLQENWGIRRVANPNDRRLELII